MEWYDLQSQTVEVADRRTALAIAADELVTCLDTVRPPRSAGCNGRAALEMVMAIYESERRGNAKVHFSLPSGPSSLHVMRDEGFFGHR